MSRPKRRPQILTRDQIRLAIKAGKRPFLVWKDHPYATWGPDNKRIMWSPSLEHCLESYAEHKGWIVKETTVDHCLSLTGV